MVSTIPGYLTIAEAAAVLGRDESQVRRYCNGRSTAKLKARKVGKTWLIRKEDLRSFEKPEMGNPNFRK